MGNTGREGKRLATGMPEVQLKGHTPDDECSEYRGKLKDRQQYEYAADVRSSRWSGMLLKWKTSTLLREEFEPHEGF